MAKLSGSLCITKKNGNSAHFTPNSSHFTYKKSAIRIIRDVGKAWFSDILRAGFALAHTAPYRKSAFTLAEVLITLGIIGVVAAMTIPGLVGKYKDKVMITQTKKTYATILSALDKLKYEMGASDYTGVFLQDKSVEENANLFFSKFKTLQICDRGKKGCTTSTFKYPSVKNDGKGKNASFNATYFYRGILPDGSVVGINPYVGGDAECGRIFNNKKTDADGNWISDGKGGYETVASYSKQCGTLMIDANGIKAPNQLGADVFFFIIGPKKISNYITKIDTVLTDESLQYTDYQVGGDFGQ